MHTSEGVRGSATPTQEGSGRTEAMEHDDGTTYDELQVGVEPCTVWRCVLSGGVSCATPSCLDTGSKARLRQQCRLPGRAGPQDT